MSDQGSSAESGAVSDSGEEWVRDLVVEYDWAAGPVNLVRPPHGTFAPSRRITRLALAAGSGLLGSPEEERQVLREELQRALDRGEVPEHWRVLLEEADAAETSLLTNTPLEIVVLSGQEAQDYIAAHPSTRDESHRTFPSQEQADGSIVYYAPADAVTALRRFLDDPDGSHRAEG